MEAFRQQQKIPEELSQAIGVLFDYSHWGPMWLLPGDTLLTSAFNDEVEHVFPKSQIYTYYISEIYRILSRATSLPSSSYTCSALTRRGSSRDTPTADSFVCLTNQSAKYICLSINSALSRTISLDTSTFAASKSEALPEHLIRGTALLHGSSGTRDCLYQLILRKFEQQSRSHVYVHWQTPG